ncbi:PilZ domain-containing protein [Acanthopleuribacter pedis]|uniref:PilZ domain-containing protein n=1 Tax=Acanthopleuribacter pedis TaxID=442870 RepID=A0A8J7QB07_9BACT|nr:PilZ domain-containing protein [Acanthopleuribacter pedis]MBO1322186.1 PilZ domain-containing protein [Acanthopleuribacter pedis]
MHHEKRKFRRLPTRGFMDCTVEFSLDEHRFKDIPVLSISAGGAYLAVDAQQPLFEKGSRLCGIRFNVPELNTMFLDGLIIHKMSLGEIGGCGVEFAGTTDLDRLAIDTFVATKLAEFGLD